MRYGTISPEALVAQAKTLGVKRLALTDINLSSGIFDFVKECIAAEIEPVVGVEFRNGDDLKYICLAQNHAGYVEINQHLTAHLLSETVFPSQSPNFQNVYVIYPIEILDSYRQLKPNEFVGVRHWDFNKLFRYKSKLDASKLVLWQPVTFLDRPNYNLHRLLRAIDHNVLLSRLSPTGHATAHESFVTPEQLRQLFKSYPELIENTERILESCSFVFDYKSPKNKKIFTSTTADDLDLLRKLAYDGILYRYGKNNKEAIKRVERELKIIEELHFGSYFLITWDIIKYGKSRGYYHVGRGSGANSIVAYCIGITDVDPIELDLYFERFINPHRTSPPDFDIDFSWDERDEIIDYVFKRYGREHVSLMATYNTFKGRSIYRELGKVFGLPKPEIDELINNPNANHRNEHTQYIFKYAPMMINFPEHLSIHAGGMLISEEPMAHYSALQPMPKGFPICQFDMYVAEEIGFAKFDVLSQRGLGHIKTCVDIVRENHKVNIDIHAIQDFKKDPEIRRQLVEHETMGAFYVESPAMRQLIWKLRCDNYLTLVAASSIIRPGVSASGMMSEYIKRHHNPTEIQYIHPKMEELLQETYGVMVYQEDVIKVAHHFAGLTLAESDVLRRAMSGKFRSKKEFERIIEKWYANCKERGYPDDIAKEVWRQIESFSGYSFSKAHSASFAVESYQSLYLKAHYPREFMVAVINNFGGFYNTEMYAHEARRYGAKIEAPDINESHYLTRIEGIIIWLGWIHIQGLESRTIDALLDNRRSEGQYLSFQDFVHRVYLGLEQLTILIRVGAFRAFGLSKKELLWEAHFFHHKTQKMVEASPALFEWEEQKFELPALISHGLEDRYDEIELLGFPLESAFTMISEAPLSKLSAAQLGTLVGRHVKIYGYMVTYKAIRTKNNKKMAFGYFIDHEGEFFDTTHFPQNIERYPFRGKGVYYIEGKVVEEFGFPSVEVLSMRKCGIKMDPRAG
ncbi:DNA polymerase III subunit alpha [Lacihabitans sp. LS3-19]|uniref:DNA polymerase III subunit alpha n=1 Tax=Lacihabitans sp. LS3-19 TaxID=2487335 RepID=UPI0020CFBA12|nr:DNA polymerase III subunit alpha [Lacihabitans sp. LS3-19]